MATRKKSTDQPEPPVKRNRQSAKPKPSNEGSPQQDLLASPEPAQSTECASVQQPAMPTTEDFQNIDSSPAGLQPSDSLEQDQVSLPEPVRTDIESKALLVGAPDSSDSGSDPVEASSQTWLLVTNHLNMLYMLAAGMVTGPAGFSGKHYRDPSNDIPGWIPLFRGVSPDQAVKQAVSEQKHLRPCIAKIDLAQLSGATQLVCRDGGVSSETLPLSIGPSAAGLLVPAPLPMTLVTGLIFRSADDRKAFEATAHNYANVDLTGLNIQVAEQFFSSELTLAWPLPEESRTTIPPVVDQPPANGIATGGILAMLYHLANRSDLCCAAFRVACGAGNRDDIERVQKESTLAELEPWIRSGKPGPEASVPAKLFWGVVQALVDARQSESTSEPVDVVVDFLEGEVARLQRTSLQSRLERLISDMRSTFGLGGGTISQLFERHKGTLTRPLLLFCLRERCVDLLEFSHPALEDEDLVLAGILFGARDGWIGLPVDLRAPERLSLFVTYRMFEAECSPRNTRLSLSSMPPRPIPLRELLVRSDTFRSSVRNLSLVDVVRRFGWDDCLVSRICFSPGQYRLNVSSDGIEIVVRGNMSSPAVEIEKAALLKRAAHWPPLPQGQESELRMALGYGGSS